MGYVYNGFGGAVIDRGIPVSIYDSLSTNGRGLTILPYKINADYDVYIDFTVNSYVDNTPVLGNSGGGGYLHLTMFNHKWYASQGTTETNFAGSTNGRHNFRVNANGGYFDGTRVMNYTPTTAGYYIYLAQRTGTSNIFNGKIHEFKITSISTGNIICDYKPVNMLGYDGIYGNQDNNFLIYGTKSSIVTDTIELFQLPTLIM